MFSSLPRGLMAALAVLVAAGLAPLSAHAQTPMSGTFIAEARCPALQSIRRKSNPGTVTTEPGAIYEIVGRNTDPATHYYLVFPGAEPDRRWIGVGCGRIATPSDLSAEAKPRSPAPKTDGRGSAALGAALAQSTAMAGGDHGDARQPASPAGRSPYGRYGMRPFAKASRDAANAAPAGKTRLSPCMVCGSSRGTAPIATSRPISANGTKPAAGRSSPPPN